MAFTTVPDRATGYVVLESDWDTYIKDDINLLAGHQVCQGRLTLLSGGPVPTVDQTAKATLYWTPFLGNQVSVFNGTSWIPYTFSELSLALGALLASTNYDIFLYDDAGTLTLQAVAWASGTARATALTSVNGVLVKSGANTYRYLGTIRITAVAGECEDSTSRRFVYNYYGRRWRPMVAVETTNSWTYTTAIWRQANGVATVGVTEVQCVIGIDETPVRATAVSVASNNASSAWFAAGIGINSTTVNSASLVGAAISAANDIAVATAHYEGFPGIGVQQIQWLEISQALGTTTWYGDNGLAYLQAGLMAEIEA